MWTALRAAVFSQAGQLRHAASVSPYSLRSKGRAGIFAFGENLPVPALRAAFDLRCVRRSMQRHGRDGGMAVLIEQRNMEKGSKWRDYSRIIKQPPRGESERGIRGEAYGKRRSEAE